MLNAPIVLYLGSRGLSAAGNLLAVAIFTRLAGRADYGEYLLIFAWALIVYGFTAHWMRFAYFGVFQSRRGDEYVVSLAGLLAAALAVVAVGLTVVALCGFFTPIFLLAVFSLICGMTVYEAASEVTRTRLDAAAVALGMVVRTCLTIVLGSFALWFGGGPTGLAFAIALAHLIGAAPCLREMLGLRLSHASRAAVRQMLVYGWPLLLSFGVMAVGQTIDRLLLAHYSGAAALGPYGAIADLLRQSFAVVGEAITLSFITVAKRHANDGDVTACNEVLRTAFNASLAAAAFGAAFFIVFGDALVRVLLGADFHAGSDNLVLVLALAFAFMTMRNYYFAQVIFFTSASYLELVISLLFMAASTALAVLLVPAYGAIGAAIALLAAHALACVAFVASGRLYFRMPIDVAGLVEVPLAAGLFVIASQVIASLVANTTWALAVQVLLFAAAGIYVVRRFRFLRNGLDYVSPTPAHAGAEAAVPASRISSATVP